MPRPVLPPTPASSTDLQAKDHARVSPFEMSFTLPPPAMTSASSERSSNGSVNSDASYHPESPTSSVVKPTGTKHRRIPSTQKQEPQQTTHADFSLPPPPTRSRKIIQMRPSLNNPQPSTLPTSSKPTDKKGVAYPPTAATTRKPPTSTSVAGKKIARKTAHSLIERRRRSKMNEEFGVLKDMIPACHGQDMHKLAILQASIDYLRYLEQCVADLKAANASLPVPAQYHSQAPTPQALSSASPTVHDDDSEDDEDEDLEMQDRTSADASPAIAAVPSREFSAEGYNSSATSPMMPPSQNGTHTSSYTSISSLPSPAFSAYSYQASHPPGYRSSYAHSTELSPALMANAMQDADHEATAALLMLTTDRRHAGTGRAGGRGMSVRDLLSA
ncbi:hypothetical protein MMC34_004818 [Xylographa carneopallida]|nr:hypothetical protein [Xylographa carneopallida]